jgi:hypothetical protein
MSVSFWRRAVPHQCVRLDSIRFLHALSHVAALWCNNIGHTWCDHLVSGLVTLWCSWILGKIPLLVVEWNLLSHLPFTSKLQLVSPWRYTLWNETVCCAFQKLCFIRKQYISEMAYVNQVLLQTRQSCYSTYRVLRLAFSKETVSRTQNILLVFQIQKWSDIS